MNDDLPPDLLSRLRELNGLRRAGSTGATREELEAWFNELYRTDQQLAVYGSLAPGRPNHHVIVPTGGEWTDGLYITGDLVETGWGASAGFPALRWRVDGARIDVVMLRAPSLTAFFPALDQFEGEDYVRVLVPVFGEAGFEGVANVYEGR